MERQNKVTPARILQENRCGCQVAAAGLQQDRGRATGQRVDMNGHAAKAREFLDQASRELKYAAEAANRNHR
jgi:hypothetical protein